MRVFVTGGTGFIGHYVVKALLEKGHDVVVATRHPNKVPTLKALSNVTFVECALTDFDVRYPECNASERHSRNGNAARKCGKSRLQEIYLHQ